MPTFGFQALIEIWVSGFRGVGFTADAVLAVDVLALPPEHRERQRRANVVVLFRFGVETFMRFGFETFVQMSLC